MAASPASRASSRLRASRSSAASSASGRFGLADGPADRDGQGQRQARAGRDDLVRRLRLGRDALLAEPAGQHLVGLVVAEHVERDERGALRGHQPGHLVAAGHHDQAARRAGQQRPDLGRVARVVEHDQHPLAVHQAAEQGRPFLKRSGDPVRRDAEGVEEEPQRLARFHGRCPDPGRAG